MTVRNNENTDDIIVQIGWLVDKWRLGLRSGLLLSLLMTIIAAYMLLKPLSKGHMTYIQYGWQSVFPSLLNNKLVGDVQMEYSVPNDFTSEKNILLYNNTFYPTLHKISGNTNLTLSDIKFGLTLYQKGLFLTTSGTKITAKMHDAFHKQVSNLILQDLKTKENEVLRTQNWSVSYLKTKIGFIKSQKDKSRSDKKYFFQRMELLFKQMSGDRRPNMITSDLDDGSASLILHLTQELDKLTREQNRLQHYISSYNLQSKNGYKANIQSLNILTVLEDNISFGLKLTIWLFIIFLTFLITPFISAFLRSIRTHSDQK